MFSAAVDSNRSAPRPAQSPTLSPTRSATTPALRGSVLGDALLDLAHEVRPDVGGLGVDTAAQLGEEGDEGAPKPKPTIRKGAWATVTLPTKVL
jgi:hypothetical protein